MLQNRYDNSTEVDRDEEQKERALYIGAVIVGIVIVALSVWWFIVRTVGFHNDIAGAPTHHSDGIVKGVTYLQASEAEATPGALVTVSWDGKTEQYRTDKPPTPNQKVRVSYVIGKSGTIYIRRLDPK